MPRMELEKRDCIQRAIVEWGSDNFVDFPWRNPQRKWHGLIAEVLLQRTNAEAVVPVFEKFCRRFPTIDEFAKATEEEIADLIRPLGLRKRAALLDDLGEELAGRGGIPTDRDELEDLPGVGPYTAGAWLSLHQGEGASIVDSNVVRWLCRLIGRDFDRSTRRKNWLIDLSDEMTPDDQAREFNYAVLDFTRQVCTPKNPACGKCPIGPDLCSHGAATLGDT